MLVLLRDDDDDDYYCYYSLFLGYEYFVILVFC